LKFQLTFKLNFKCSALLSHVVETGTGCRRRRLADKSMGSKLSVVGSGQSRRTTVKWLAGPRFIGICERCLSGGSDWRRM
jgi:hypothetical protein